MCGVFIMPRAAKENRLPEIMHIAGFETMAELSESSGVPRPRISNIGNGRIYKSASPYAYTCSGELSQEAPRLSQALGSVPEHFYHPDLLYHSSCQKALSRHLAHLESKSDVVVWPTDKTLSGFGYKAEDVDEPMSALLALLFSPIMTIEKESKRERFRIGATMLVLRHIFGTSYCEAAEGLGITLTAAHGCIQDMRSFMKDYFNFESGDLGEHVDLFDHVPRR